jgi:SAM-dependent methyltransferase
MNPIELSKKIRGKSLRHLSAILRAHFMVQRILKSIDMQAFKAFQERYKDADATPGGYSKYLDIRAWMIQKLSYFYLLGLHRSRSLRILDLGTGAGFFPYLCSLYGHKVIALDLDTVPMYNELCKFLRVDRRAWRIVKFEKLPDLGVRFDLVTAFMITFNQHEQPDEWGVDEWRFMLDDLKRNQIVDGGRIFLNLNLRRNGAWCDEALSRLFVDFGGRLYLNHVAIGGPKARFL